MTPFPSQRLGMIGVFLVGYLALATWLFWNLYGTFRSLEDQRYLHLETLHFMQQLESVRRHVVEIQEELLTLAFLGSSKQLIYQHLNITSDRLQSLYPIPDPPQAIAREIQEAWETLQNLEQRLPSLRSDEERLKRFGEAIFHLKQYLLPFLQQAQETSLIYQKDPDGDEGKARLLQTLRQGEILEVQTQWIPAMVEQEIHGVLQEGPPLRQILYSSLLPYMILILLFLLGLLGGISLYQKRRFSLLPEAIRRIQQGEPLPPLPPSADPFLQEIYQGLETLAATIRQQQQHLEQMVVVDPLTGAYNRRYFQMRLQEEMKRFRRYNTIFSIALIDLDHFKEINDTYGHAQGDRVLQELVDLIRKNTRETDILARYGGEEFVILYTCTDRNGAFTHMERLRETVAHHPFPGMPRPVTISVGISDAAGKDSSDQILQEADLALYRAKRTGRNRCVVYSNVVCIEEKAGSGS